MSHFNIQIKQKLFLIIKALLLYVKMQLQKNISFDQNYYSQWILFKQY